MLILCTTTGFGLVTHVTKALVDDGQEHAHAHKHHHENEQAERQRAEEWRRFGQLLGIELHQDRLEQHLCRVQQSRTGAQLTREQQIEQHDERPEHDREHRRERHQIFGRVLKCADEEHQPMVETTKTNELDRREEAAEAE